MIYKLDPKEEHKDTPEKKVLPVLDQDLNCLPFEEDESELPDDETDVESSSGLESNSLSYLTDKSSLALK